MILCASHTHEEVALHRTDVLAQHVDPLVVEVHLPQVDVARRHIFVAEDE